MSRIVALIGRDEAGKLGCIGIAEGDGIGRLLEKRSAVMAADGFVSRGKKELKLSEMVCMGTETRRGKFKQTVKFPSKAELKAREERAKAEAEAKAKAEEEAKKDETEDE